jgi:uncharacterized delta-60 repeat protein
MLKLISFTVKLTAIAFFVIFIQTLETKAAWGDLDTNFGFQGAAADTVTGHQPRSVALQADGKILVTGYRAPTPLSGERFFLRRYLANGSLDTAFGTNGAAIGPETNTLSTDYLGHTIVVFANGKIAVAGLANGNCAVWQFNSNGKADKTFGVNGLQILTGYPGSYSPEMDIQSGKILLSVRKLVGNDLRVVLVRLTSTGALDTHFGSAGESLTGVYGGKGSGTVVETDGKITIGGVKYNDLSAKGLERKLSSGQDDLTFSPPTVFSFSIESPGLVKMVNGKYAMRWGNLAGNGSITFYLQKFSSAGVIESTITPMNAYPNGGCPEVFTNQNDGKLIVQYLGLLFRTNSEIDGSSIEISDCANLGGIAGSATRAAIQPDDKMITAGVYNGYLMLVRQLPD